LEILVLIFYENINKGIEIGDLSGSLNFCKIFIKLINPVIVGLIIGSVIINFIGFGFVELFRVYILIIFI